MCLSMDGPRPWRGQRRAEAWLRSRSPSSSTLSPPLWAHMLGRPGGLDGTGIGKDQSQINCSSSTNMISPSIGNASMNNQRGHVSKKWWYMGCELCKKRLHNEGGSYYCQPCDCRSAIPMYKFSLIAADETAEARFFCHDIVAHHLICRNYNSLLKPISYPPGLPAQMLAIIPRKYMFPVGLTLFHLNRCQHSHQGSIHRSNLPVLLTSIVTLWSALAHEHSAPTHDKVQKRLYGDSALEYLTSNFALDLCCIYLKSPHLFYHMHEDKGIGKDGDHHTERNAKKHNITVASDLAATMQNS